MDALTLAAQFGFPAVVSVMLWLGYKEIAPRLLAVLEHNAKTSEAMAQTLERNNQAIDRLTTAVQEIDRHLSISEFKREKIA